MFTVYERLNHYCNWNIKTGWTPVFYQDRTQNSKTEDTEDELSTKAVAQLFLNSSNQPHSVKQQEHKSLQQMWVSLLLHLRFVNWSNETLNNSKQINPGIYDKWIQHWRGDAGRGHETIWNILQNISWQVLDSRIEQMKRIL